MKYFCHHVHARERYYNLYKSDELQEKYTFLKSEELRKIL